MLMGYILLLILTAHCDVTAAMGLVYRCVCLTV